jgi:hypothetical protein
MSLRGTNAKCRSHRATFEFGGGPENIYSHGVCRISTLTGLCIAAITRSRLLDERYRDFPRAADESHNRRTKCAALQKHNFRGN